MDRAIEPNAITATLEQHWRRTAVLVRALLPRQSDAEAALQAIASRFADGDHCVEALDRLARNVVSGQRLKTAEAPFSDDLIRQLADSFPPSLTLVAERSQRLADLIDRLPFAEKELLRRKHAIGLSAVQIAVADGRPANVIARDLTILHGTLVNALHESLPDGGPPAPGGAADLGRLSDQLLDGTITDDGILVLETLLLGDTPAQAHYHRHVALAVELEWLFRGAPTAPKKSAPAPAAPLKLTRRELAVTAGFLLTCVAAAVFVILLLTGQLRNWL